MKKKKVIPIIALVIIAALVITLVILFIPFGGPPTPSARKAIIVSSANDFQKSEGEDDFNDSDDANFSAESGRWIENATNGYIGQDNDLGPDGNPGIVKLIANVFPDPTGYTHIEYVYNWTKYYPIYTYAIYNLSAWVKILNQTGNATYIGSPGARIGLRWLNSNNSIIRTDWSKGIIDTEGTWVYLNITGICDGSTINKITQLHLVLAFEGNVSQGDMVWYDDVRVERWISVNVTNPINPIPPPGSIDSDGFPAQALQVYWILKHHGYSDKNIFLMLYHKNDNIIDINAKDGITNDLTGAIIDVENDDVKASRFKQELNVSIKGSFASSIKAKDQLIIYVVDHGSNKIAGEGNATFHFEADDSYITETEFYNLVKEIDCERMLINIDICFSGNFLNINSNIGQSWYDIPNSILITSTTDIFSWYWRDNSNPDGFAGSWFFHTFWDQLNQSESIQEAFDYAKNYIPARQKIPIIQIQSPLIKDNLGIKDSWSFSSIPQL
ncbi:MAG: C13 family peptidase [Promethearchaeota archaeon]